MSEHKHGADSEGLRVEDFTLEPGLKYDVPAPCCVWARFGSIVTVTIEVANAPGAGNVDTFTLYKEGADKILTPSDIVSSGFATIAANFTAGVVTRIVRTYEGGINGVRISNNLNVRIGRVSVRWAPTTIHTR